MLFLIFFFLGAGGGEFGHFGPKMVCLYNWVGSQVLFLFCTVKGFKRYMKILLVVFSEKISFGAI